MHLPVEIAEFRRYVAGTADIFSGAKQIGICTDLLAGTVRNSLSWQGCPYVWFATGFENLGDKVARFVHYSLLDICSTYLFRLDYLWIVVDNDDFR